LKDVDESLAMYDSGHGDAFALQTAIDQLSSFVDDTRVWTLIYLLFSIVTQSI